MAQVFDLLYGPSGYGKSQALVELIKFLTAQSGKKARVYSGDGGTPTYLNSGLVDAGVLDIVEYDALDWPFTVMDRMVRGWMPNEKGLWAPVPDDRYAITVFEGGAVLGKYLLGMNKGGLAWRAGQGEMIGNKKEEEVVKTKDESLPLYGNLGGVAVGSNTMGHYRHMQPRLIDAVKFSKGLGGWVIWTTHPTETVDKDEGGRTGDFGKLVGKTIVGPEFGGKAPANWVSREFGNTLHFDVATKLGDQQDTHSGKRTKVNDQEFRIYTRNHFDPDGNWLTEFKAVNRCPKPERMPDYLTDSEGDAPGFALVRFYQLMAQTRAEAKEEILKARAEAPPAA